MKPLVDRKEGIKLSYDSEELYDSIIKAYLEEAPGNMEGLTSFLSEGNFREYRVLVHAVKSNSKQIGCESLYEEAMAMENAAKEENGDYLRSNHDHLLSSYKRVLDFINNGFKEEEPASVPAILDAKTMNRDIKYLLRIIFIKLLKINLKTEEHVDILVAEEEETSELGYAKDIGQWLKDFGLSGMVHHQDVEDFLRHTDIEYLRNHFAGDNDYLVVRYRRKDGEEFKWVTMLMRKTPDYSPENPTLMLYVRSSEEEISREARINLALIDSFNALVAKSGSVDAVLDIFKIMAEFYDAPYVRLYSVDRGDLIFKYGSDEETPGEWSEIFGDGVYRIVMGAPGRNDSVGFVFRAVYMIVLFIFSEDRHNVQRMRLEERSRIIDSLSDVYFTVYLMDFKTYGIKKIKSTPMLDTLFAGLTDAREVLEVEEKYLVEDEYVESMHEFNYIDNWQHRLLGKSDISMEFLGKNHGWCRAEVIASQKDKDGLATEAIYAVREIGDQKAREQAYHDAIVEALEAAERASKAKSIFLQNVSHDVRTPMNAVLGYVNLALQNLGDGEKTGEYLEKIKMAGENLLSIINSVLDMSRIESGRLELTEEEVSLRELLLETENVFQSRMETEGHSFTLDISGVLSHSVITDRVQLFRVISNLLGNAIKYTPSHGKISLSAWEEKTSMEGYTEFTLKVKDNGIGMSSEFIEKIFLPFEREQSSVTNEIQGTGLGMSITKGIIDAMGGNISVESAPGKGSTFTVVLTLPLAGSGGSIKHLEKEMGARPSRESLNGKTILLAEDNAINREIAREVLKQFGLIIEEAVNGKEAVELLKKRGPGYFTLILMDVQMPQMNGYEATALIRQDPDPAIASIPIIAMTANAFEQDRRDAIAAGMNAHVAKPFNIDTLVDTMLSLM